MASQLRNISSSLMTLATTTINQKVSVSNLITLATTIKQNVSVLNLSTLATTTVKQNSSVWNLTTLATAVKQNESDSNLTGLIRLTVASASTPFWDLTTRVFLSAIISIIMAVAIFGNLLVFIVIIKNRGMRTRTNMFLFNLAVSDFLCAIFDMPISLVTAATGRWLFSLDGLVCKMNGFGMPFLFVASIHTLMYTSVHKYVSICNPMRQVLTKKLVSCMIVATWFWAILIGILTAYSPLTEIAFKDFTTQCGPKYPDDFLSRVHFGFVVLTCYIIPIIIIAGCCLGMFRRIRSLGQRMHMHTTMDSDVIDEQQRQLSFTLFIVLGAFFITWTPWVGYSMYTVFIGAGSAPVRALLNPITYWCGYLNSACNPVIYAFRSTAFRVGYKEVLGQSKCLRSEESGNKSSLGGSNQLSVGGPPVLPYIHVSKDSISKLDDVDPTVIQLRRSISDSSLHCKLSRSRFRSGTGSDAAPAAAKFSCSSAISCELVNGKASTSTNHHKSVSSSLLNPRLCGSDAAFVDSDAESVPSLSCETIDSTQPAPFTRGRYNKNTQGTSVELGKDNLQIPMEKRGGSTKRASARKFFSSVLRLHLPRSRSDAYNVQKSRRKASESEVTNTQKNQLSANGFSKGSFTDVRRAPSVSNYDPNSNTRKCRTLDNRSTTTNNARDLDKNGRQVQPTKFSFSETGNHHRHSVVQELMSETGSETPGDLVRMSNLVRGMSIEKLDSAIEAEYGMRKRSATVAVPASGKHASGLKAKRAVRRSISAANKCAEV